MPPHQQNGVESDVAELSLGDLCGSHRAYNVELSWLAFNWRVLSLASAVSHSPHWFRPVFLKLDPDCCPMANHIVSTCRLRLPASSVPAVNSVNECYHLRYFGCPDSEILAAGEHTAAGAASVHCHRVQQPGRVLRQAGGRPDAPGSGRLIEPQGTFLPSPHLFYVCQFMICR